MSKIEIENLTTAQANALAMLFADEKFIVFINNKFYALGVELVKIPKVEYADINNGNFSHIVNF